MFKLYGDQEILTFIYFKPFTSPVAETCHVSKTVLTVSKKEK